MSRLTRIVDSLKGAWNHFCKGVEDFHEANKQPRVIPVSVEAAIITVTAALTYKNPKMAVCCLAAVKGVMSAINGRTVSQTIALTTAEAARAGSLVLVGNLGERMRSRGSLFTYLLLPALHGVLGACMSFIRGDSPVRSFLATANAKLTSSLMDTADGAVTRTTIAMASAVATSAIAGANDPDELAMTAADAAAAHLLNDQLHMTRHGPRINGRPVDDPPRHEERSPGPHDPRPIPKPDPQERSTGKSAVEPARNTNCSNCHGSGSVIQRSWRACFCCRGRGVLVSGTEYKLCPVCRGKKARGPCTVWVTCSKCNGSGKQE